MIELKKVDEGEKTILVTKEFQIIYVHTSPPLFECGWT